MILPLYCSVVWLNNLQFIEHTHTKKYQIPIIKNLTALLLIQWDVHGSDTLYYEHEKFCQ